MASTATVGQVKITVEGERVVLESLANGKKLELNIGEFIAAKMDTLYDRLAVELQLQKPFDLRKAQYEAAALYLKNQPLRKTISFLWIEGVYAKPKPPVDIGGELYNLDHEYTIYFAYWRENAPPVILIDVDGYINPRITEYSLKKIGDEDKIREILLDLPPSILRKVIAVFEKWGIDVKREKNEEGEKESEEEYVARLAGVAARLGIFYSPVPILRSVEFLKKVDWRDLVDMALNYGGGVDGRLVLVRAASFLKGVVAKLNPHFIVVTPGGWGKSSFYKDAGAGIHYTKITPATLLGYTRGKKEKYYGVLHGVELPCVIDQIEGEAQFGLYNKLPDVMDGSYTVGSGAQELKQWTKAILGFLANPLGMGNGKDFQYILEIITNNPTVGRRFGLIFYTKEMKSYRERPKMSESDVRKWRDIIRLIRAVEDYARKEIYSIYRNSVVEKWLGEELPEFEAEIYRLIEENEGLDENLKLFLREHGSGAHGRIRNAALRIAILYNLDKIALGEYDVKHLLSEAEKYIDRIVSLNILSIKVILQDVSESSDYIVQAGFEGEPDYMKVIISAVELYRRTVRRLWENGDIPEALSTLNLSNLNYTPNYGNYQYFSKALYKLKQKRKEIDNNRLQQLYGFQLFVEREYVVAHILNWKDLPIKPIGDIDELQILTKITEYRASQGPSPSPVSKMVNKTSSISPVSPFHQKVCKDMVGQSGTELSDSNHSLEKTVEKEDVESQKIEGSKNTPLSTQTGEMVKSVKLVNRVDHGDSVFIDQNQKRSKRFLSKGVGEVATLIARKLLSEGGSMPLEEFDRWFKALDVDEQLKKEALEKMILEERVKISEGRIAFRVRI